MEIQHSLDGHFPFGDSRNSQGNLGTDILFTGQRLDDTGLYYYGARYYDSNIGRFISPDTIVQDPANPQNLNRYSYVINNPLKYIDPTGLWWTVSDDCQDIWIDDDTGEITPGYEQIIKQAEADKAQPAVPQVPQLPIEEKTPIEPIITWTRIDYVGQVIENLEETYQNIQTTIQTFVENTPVLKQIAEIEQRNQEYIEEHNVVLGIAPVIGPAGSGGIIKGFTSHGIDQAISRNGVGVSERAMLGAVKNPLRVIPQSGERLKYIGQNAVVILNNAGKVITTWARNSLGWRIK